MTNDDRGSCSDGKPPGPDCGGRYPSTKGCWEYFAPNVQTPIHIGIDEALARCLIYPPTDTPAATFGRLAPVGIIGWDWVQIEKTGLARVSFFGDLDLDAHKSRLVLQHLEKPGMGDLDKGLIRAFAHLDLLLPERILPNDQGTDACLQQHANETMRSHMQIVLDTPIAFVGELLKLPAGVAVLLGELALKDCAPFVVLLVDTFQRTPVNENGHKARGV